MSNKPLASLLQSKALAATAHKTSTQNKITVAEIHLPKAGALTSKYCHVWPDQVVCSPRHSLHAESGNHSAQEFASTSSRCRSALPDAATCCPEHLDSANPFSADHTDQCISQASTAYSYSRDVLQGSSIQQ